MAQMTLAFQFSYELEDMKEAGFNHMQHWHLKSGIFDKKGDKIIDPCGKIRSWLGMGRLPV